MAIISSMTGFASLALDYTWGRINWEIRTVNSRHLELNFKLPEALQMLEPELRVLAQKFVTRGKLEASLKLETSYAANSTSQLDYRLIAEVIQAYHAFKQQVPEAGFDFAKFITWPQAWSRQALDLSCYQQEITDSLIHTMQALQQTRVKEGQSIVNFLNTRLQAIEQQLQIAHEIVPMSLAQTKSKLLARLAAFSLEPNRLEQEIVLLAQKLDVSEELSRLAEHCHELNRLLEQGGIIGRRLDFMMQELNREANTLGAKSVNCHLTQVAVELKVLIEQMREQIQNME